MSRQRISVSGIVRSILLSSFAALLTGCSESDEAVTSRTVPDSSVVESSSSAVTEVDTRIPEPQAAASLDNVAVPVTPDSIPAATTTEVPEPVVTQPSKSKREPIYVEEANGKELIAAALRKAQRDHKHVLIEWGGNWCGWCFKLHDVFHNQN